VAFRLFQSRCFFFQDLCSNDKNVHCNIVFKSKKREALVSNMPNSSRVSCGQLPRDLGGLPPPPLGARRYKRENVKMGQYFCKYLKKKKKTQPKNNAMQELITCTNYTARALFSSIQDNLGGFLWQWSIFYWKWSWFFQAPKSKRKWLFIQSNSCTVFFLGGWEIILSWILCHRILWNWEPNWFHSYFSADCWTFRWKWLSYRFLWNQTYKTITNKTFRKIVTTINIF